MLLVSLRGHPHPSQPAVCLRRLDLKGTPRQPPRLRLRVGIGQGASRGARGRGESGCLDPGSFHAALHRLSLYPEPSPQSVCSSLPCPALPSPPLFSLLSPPASNPCRPRPLTIASTPGDCTSLTASPTPHLLRLWQPSLLTFFSHPAAICFLWRPCLMHRTSAC